MSDKASKAAERRFKEIVWLSGARGATAGGEMVNWTLGGAAAGFALALTTLKDGDAHVHDFELHLTLILLTASVIVGAVAKYYGILVKSMTEALQHVHDWMQSDEGGNVIRHLPDDTSRLDAEIVAPYRWPVSWLMHLTFGKRASDPFVALTSNISLQARWAAGHLILLIAAIASALVGIK